MKLNLRTSSYIIIVVGVLALIALAMYSRQKKSEELNSLLAAIDKEPRGCSGVSGNARADSGFDADHYAYMIYSAKGSFLTNDNEDQVWLALGNKNASEIAALDAAMQSKYGLTLKGYLKTFLDEAEMRRVETLIG